MEELTFTKSQVKSIVGNSILRPEFAIREQIENWIKLTEDHRYGRADYPGSSVVLDLFIRSLINASTYTALLNVVRNNYPYTINIEEDEEQ